MGTVAGLMADAAPAPAAGETAAPVDAGTRLADRPSEPRAAAREDGGAVAKKGSSALPVDAGGGMEAGGDGATGPRPPAGPRR